MTHSLSRRQFLAAAAALTACGKRAFAAETTRASPSSARRVPARQTPALEGETKLFLPATSGSATGFKFADSPRWVRNTPGWYIPDTLSAGSCLLDFLLRPDYRLSRLKSFRELPTLLTEARSLGTDAIYLVEWYEGRPGSLPRDYWTSKGDYVPRLDLGGEAALKDGITALHALGGRIILYVEGFIIDQESKVGKQHGAQWSLQGPSGPPRLPYPGAWKLCPAAEGWVAFLESVAHRIGQYGADGIFIDSYGYQKDWECVSRSHGHPLGSREVFNNGAARLVGRVRAALHAANPEGVILTEGPVLQRLFEHTDGSLDWGIHSLVQRWLWDAQGKTDTVTTGWSLDDWHQILALGAKLCCPAQFFETPPHSSAQAVLDEALKRNMKADRRNLRYVAHTAFWGLQKWRNSGLILGLRMPGLDDLVPRQALPHMHDPVADLYRDGSTLRRTLEGLHPRAALIDKAFAGRPAPAPTAYLKTLLTARQTLARFIDHGSSVAPVKSGSPRAAAWRFRGANGMALTAVNVADEPVRVTFPDAPGTWRDGVSGEELRAQDSRLTVAVPAHGVRLLSAR